MRWLAVAHRSFIHPFEGRSRQRAEETHLDASPGCPRALLVQAAVAPLPACLPTFLPALPPIAPS